MKAAAEQFAFALESGAASDVGTVAAIMERAFDPRFGEAWTRAQCSGILPLSGVRLTIARASDGEALGFSLMRQVADEAELLLLAVVPEARGRGVGGALISQFIASSRSLGARRLHLEVRDGNGAIAIYRKSGFTIAGRRSGYYSGRDGETFDALTMNRVA